MILEILIGIIAFTIIGIASTYKIVPPTEAHLVTSESGRFVASSDNTLGIDGENTKRAYFAIPSFIPFFGTQIRVMNVAIKEIQLSQETFEKNQARFMADSSTKYRIKNIKIASETFSTDEEVEEQLKGVIASSVRDVTSKVDVIEARSNKQKMEDSIKQVMNKNLEAWGLELVNFQVVDLRDTDKSSIITDISLRREKEISADTRIQNAERIKQARVKEAEADEIARQREIEKDQRIAEQEQIKKMKVAEQEKIAQQRAYDVLQVQTIRQAEIDKEKAIVLANQLVETETINRERKRLEGEGDRLKLEEQAKGEASPIREKGFAEAEALDKKQEALNKFTPQAIQALTAEQLVSANKDVGIATANALSKADVRVLAGGDQSGLNLGKLVESMSVASPNVASAFINKLSRPNDLGFTASPNNTPVLDKEK